MTSACRMAVRYVRNVDDTMCESIRSSDSEETGSVRINHVVVLTHKITRRVFVSMGEREPKRSERIIEGRY